MNQLQTIVNDQVATKSSLELLELVNEIRVEFGESQVRHGDFVARCKSELDGEYYETFVVKNQHGPATEAIRMTQDQCKLVAMRESKGVRRKVLARLNELEAKSIAAPDLESPEGKLLMIQDLVVKQLALLSDNKRITAERDHAIATKAQIGSRREATAMATAAANAKEVERLKGELGRNQQHATVVAVEKVSGRKFPKNAYVALRRATAGHGLISVSVMDPRYGSVKAWPAAAWLDCYDIDLAELFGGEAA